MKWGQFLMPLASVSASMLALNSQAAPSTEELARTIEQQQRQIDALTQAIEAEESTEQSSGLHIGGYAEHHFNHYNDGVKDDQIDAHRWVLLFNYEFTDKLRVYNELELEHSLAGDGKPGEVELEQAYIEWDYATGHSFKTGLFLIPVGILNETHEPDTFYGVERNGVEKNIIPTTWWETGAGLLGRFGEGFSYDVSVHSGLETSTFNIRSGRQKSAKATAETWASTGRLKFTGIRGLELAATLQYQSDLTQGTAAEAASATLLETHAIYQSGPFGLRALYATWDIDGAAAQAAGADEQEGYYIEPSYKVTNNLGVFYRYSAWDTQAGDNTDSEVKQSDVGVNYWLHERVVIKADIQNQSGAGNLDGFNLGVGWSFN